MLSNTGMPAPPKNEQTQIHRAEEAREREQDVDLSRGCHTFPGAWRRRGALGDGPGVRAVVETSSSNTCRAVRWRRSDWHLR